VTQEQLTAICGRHGKVENVLIKTSVTAEGTRSKGIAVV